MLKIRISYRMETFFMKGEKYMKRPMKLLSMFTAASLAFSSFAAMAIPMTAYAADVFTLKSIAVSGNQGTIVEGTEKEIELSIVETFEKTTVENENDAVAMEYKNATLISAVDEDDNDSASSFSLATPSGSATADAEKNTETNKQVLTVADNLSWGEYTLEIGVGEVKAEYKVVITKEYEAIITPNEVALNKTTTSKKIKGSYKKNSSGAASGITYEWHFYEDEDGLYKAFELSAKDKEEITVSVSKDADTVFEKALEKAKKDKKELKKIQAELILEVKKGDTPLTSEAALVTYTPVEEKKDEPKDDKAPAAKGTEIKETSGTYKVTENGEVEYVAPAPATSKTVAIPDEIKDEKGNVYKVTSIAPNAFKNNKKVTKAVVGKNVTTIGANAFAGCKKLKNLELNGNVVKTIGKNAFKGTKKGLKVKIFAKNKKTAQKLFNKVVKKGKAKEATLKFKKRAK